MSVYLSLSFDKLISPPEETKWYPPSQMFIFFSKDVYDNILVIPDALMCYLIFIVKKNWFYWYYIEFWETFLEKSISEIDDSLFEIYPNVAIDYHLIFWQSYVLLYQKLRCTSFLNWWGCIYSNNCLHLIFIHKKTLKTPSPICNINVDIITLPFFFIFPFRSFLYFVIFLVTYERIEKRILFLIFVTTFLLCSLLFFNPLINWVR